MQILIPIIIVVVIGVLAGLLLAFASKFMSVKSDERTEKIRECLPGANCGACGYSGCDGYAAAIASGEATPDKCAPGGSTTAAALSEILGIEIKNEKHIAFIACGGNSENTTTKFNYDGMKSCAAAAMTLGGPLDCEFGCLGFGDCVKACPFGAISLKDGRPQVDEDTCMACGLCVSTCPKGIIKLIPQNKAVRVNCSNCKRGAEVVKACKVSCIACKMCENNCPTGAIKVENNVAVVDPKLCNGCGNCKTVCKRGCII